MMQLNYAFYHQWITKCSNTSFVDKNKLHTLVYFFFSFFSFFSFNFLIKPQARYETNKICILFIYSEDRYSRYFCMCAPGMNIDKKRK